MEERRRRKKTDCQVVFIVGFSVIWTPAHSTGNEKAKESMPQCYNLPATMKCGRLQLSSQSYFVCVVVASCYVWVLFKLAPKFNFRVLPTFCSPMEPYVLVK